MATIFLMLISIAQTNVLAIVDERVTSPTSAIVDEQVTSSTSVIVDEQVAYSTWTAPVGIPVPPFGIDQTYRMYDDINIRNQDLVYQPSADGGCFTHYVDSTDPNATNTNNAYGSIKKPRTTVPYPLVAGSVVEVHNAAEFSSIYNITMNGTEDQPVFIRGVGDPTFQLGGIIKGCYGILEGIYLYTGALEVRPHDGSSAHHICIRDCELEGAATAGSGGVYADVYGASGNVFQYIVFYNNEIHHGGDSEYATENDNHGIVVSSYCNHIWILDNNIHHMGGDSIQINGSVASTKYIYIGGNTFHDDRENAVDIKKASHVIISQNEAYGYESCSSASGDAFCVHYDPCNIYWLFNTIHDSNYGIISSGCTKQYIIGNLIYDIHGGLTGHTPESPHRSGIGIRWYNTGNTYVANNILYNCSTGIGADILSYPTTIACNVFCNINGDGYHLSIQGKGLSSSKVINSIFYQFNGSVRIYWGGTYTFSEFQSDPNKSSGCLEVAPLFINPENGIFNLQSTSPFLEMEISEEAEAIYDRFLKLYGIDLRLDIEGYDRVWMDIADLSPSSEVSPSPGTLEEETSQQRFGNRARRKITFLNTKRKFSTKQIFDRYEDIYGFNRRVTTSREFFE